ncbi:nucleosome binding protein [Moniliophthora roreri MCA 2997]|uniref:Nucleosome binding protein n=2 Tax=Moniliophthora roreri TaxID=221103 RepID=V2Y0J5_MONRO|nr:nucleosome binding protein [Moniliophthora roreri MCA 2997]
MPKETTKAKRKAAEKAEKAPRKPKKDPKAPKRALSAYMFFSQDWRERIKAENPDASFGEVGKLLGAKWKELDDEEKKPYIEQAAKDKERAEGEKIAYDSGKKSAENSDKDEADGGKDEDESDE